ncbi:hypothetical protein NQ317_017891 [Molorchus minor]|uniref:G protein-coupled receptor n=1 Tax=Molorchus minor TaxID=1323400 RepID=A0ABQ9J5Z5_9CUCU|nr:hypothetical protein NQ317_017891 [Molorchus minor]
MFWADDFLLSVIDVVVLYILLLERRTGYGICRPVGIADGRHISQKECIFSFFRKKEYTIEYSVVASYLKLPCCMLYWSLLTKIFSDITGRCWYGYHDNKASCWLEINMVAEGYVENSIENKTKIANQVLVGTTTSTITKTVNVSESNIPSNINFENCTNVYYANCSATRIAKFPHKTDIKIKHDI